VIVADTNLVAYLLIEGTQTAIAKAVWAKDPHWMLPTIWRSEFLNVLTTAVRADALTLEEAHQAWHAALTLFGANEFEPSGDDILERAAERNVSAYDAQFVVAAADLDVPLITSDRRLLAACTDLALSPQQFCDELA
jgi:predicted nucleic acid-binding protein